MRYIRIDTSEREEPLYSEAARFNKKLVPGKRVRLQRDISEKDCFGRLLRYVYAGDILVNAELVREGYAQAREYPPDTRYAPCFTALEREARDGGRGLWAR